MIIATAGHVDHGKTTLVKALTGVDTDQLEEEKARGLTINLGFAYRDAETGGRLGFVDVPGHIRFINNMLAGVAAVDFAMLVIAADDGIMPQTTEHLEILDLLGVSEGLVALTKTDRADEARVSEVMGDITQLLQGTALSGADIYPVSAITGEGMDTLLLALTIAADDITRRSSEGCFRLAVDRRFNVKGSGIVVTGSVFAGETVIGDELRLMPQNIPVRVRGLHTQNQVSETATVGDRCAMNIASNQLEIEQIHRGNWITSNLAAATERFDATIKVLPNAARALRHWTPVHLHAAANHVTARVAVLEDGRIEPGASGLAQLVLDEPINVCVGDRIVIRDQAALNTLGGGEVLTLTSPRRGRARPERIEFLNRLDATSPAGSLNNLVGNEAYGVNLTAFSEAFNLGKEATEALLDDMDVTWCGSEHVIDTPQFDALAASLASGFDEWHKANPGKQGMPQNQVIKLLCRAWPIDVATEIIRSMLAAGELSQSGNTMGRPGVSAQLDARSLAIFEKAKPLLEAEPTKPPVLHDLAASLDVPPKDLAKILDEAMKVGLVVRPVKNRYFAPEGIEELKAALPAACGAGGRLTVKDYRDVTGIGRNLCIEILEYFDRLGITRRIGDEREIMQSGE